MGEAFKLQREHIHIGDGLYGLLDDEFSNFALNFEKTICYRKINGNS